MKPTAIIVCLAAAAALLACGGQSSQDKAKSQVCDARADISKQVDTLKGLTPSTATTSQIQSSIKAISDDIKTIANAQGDLNDERKSQVQAANKAFTDQVKSIASSVVSSTSISDAKTQLSSAFGDLATSYENTFAKVDCG